MIALMPDHDRNMRPQAMHSCIQADSLHPFTTFEKGPRLVPFIMMAVHVHAGTQHDTHLSMRWGLRGCE